MLSPTHCFPDVREAQALNEFPRSAKPGVGIVDLGRFVGQGAQRPGVKMILVAVRDGDDPGRINCGRVYRLRENIPLLAVCRSGKPGVGRDAHITRIDEQTGVGYVFNFHEVLRVEAADDTPRAADLHLHPDEQVSVRSQSELAPLPPASNQQPPMVP